MWTVPAAIVSPSRAHRPAEDTCENTKPLPGPGLAAVSLMGMLTSPYPAPPEASPLPGPRVCSDRTGREGRGSWAGDVCSGH